jgi:excisionase family DNA binding protein
MIFSYEPFLTTGEAAAMLRVERVAIVRWCKAGKLDSIRTPGGHRRVKEADILAILSGEKKLRLRPR